MQSSPDFSGWVPSRAGTFAFGGLAAGRRVAAQSPPRSPPSIV